jgi:hypothetical protein
LGLSGYLGSYIKTNIAGSVEIFVPKARPAKIQYQENSALFFMKK